MNKEKRIKYRIKKLKLSDLSYIKIGERISGFKKLLKKSSPKLSSLNVSSSTKTKMGRFKYLINLMNKIYVWIIKHFQKKESKDRV